MPQLDDRSPEAVVVVPFAREEDVEKHLALADDGVLANLHFDIERYRYTDR